MRYFLFQVIDGATPHPKTVAMPHPHFPAETSVLYTYFREKQSFYSDFEFFMNNSGAYVLGWSEFNSAEDFMKFTTPKPR